MTAAPLTLAETQRLRRTPGATVLLFLTDRCPVGCGHCSVSSRPDSAAISDRALFGELVAGIAGLGGVDAVGITGGEPFTERTGLRHAVTALRRAGKRIAVYTSGHWASTGRVPAWVRDVLRDVDTVFLSVDDIHASRVDDARTVRAAGAIADAGCHLILQVVDEPDSRARLDRLRARLPAGAETSVVAPLRHGRGRDVFTPPPRRPMSGFGQCALTASPTVRFDGTVLACCGESVIMGAGPAALRRQVRHRDELAPALRELRSTPVLQAVGRDGPRSLTMLPLSSVPAGEGFSSICHACWAAHEAVERSPDSARLLAALAATGHAPRGTAP